MSAANISSDLGGLATTLEWTNSILATRQLAAASALTDFSDGVLLIALIECAFNLPVGTIVHNQAPRTVFHRINNVSAALDYLRKVRGVMLTSIDSRAVVGTEAGDDRAADKAISALLYAIQREVNAPAAANANATAGSRRPPPPSRRPAADAAPAPASDAVVASASLSSPTAVAVTASDSTAPLQTAAPVLFSSSRAFFLKQQEDAMAAANKAASRPPPPMARQKSSAPIAAAGAAAAPTVQADAQSATVASVVSKPLALDTGAFVALPSSSSEEQASLSTPAGPASASSAAFLTTPPFLLPSAHNVDASVSVESVATQPVDSATTVALTREDSAVNTHEVAQVAHVQHDTLGSHSAENGVSISDATKQLNSIDKTPVSPTDPVSEAALPSLCDASVNTPSDSAVPCEQNECSPPPSPSEPSVTALEAASATLAVAEENIAQSRESQSNVIVSSQSFSESSIQDKVAATATDDQAAALDAQAALEDAEREAQREAEEEASRVALTLEQEQALACAKEQEEEKERAAAERMRIAMEKYEAAERMMAQQQQEKLEQEQIEKQKQIEEERALQQREQEQQQIEKQHQLELEAQRQLAHQQQLEQMQREEEQELQRRKQELEQQHLPTGGIHETSASAQDEATPVNISAAEDPSSFVAVDEASSQEMSSIESSDAHSQIPSSEPKPVSDPEPEPLAPDSSAPIVAVAATSDTASPALPSPWEMLIDDSRGVAYYHNPLTGEVRWEAPSHDDAAVHEMQATPVAADAAAAAEDAAASLPDGWQSLVDSATGAVYYHHAATGTTSWERPAAVSVLVDSGTLIADASAAVSAKPSIDAVSEPLSEDVSSGDQASAHAAAAAASAAAALADERLTSRAKVLDEIIRTEAAYVGQLQSLVQTFMQPLQAELAAKNQKKAFGAAKPEDVAALFSNVSTLCEFHATFLEDLRSKPIPQVFLAFAPFLQLYIEYVNAFTGSAETLRRLQQVEEFATWIETQNARLAGLDISALLIAPVQRIPRYALLLREVIRYTDADRADHAQLTTALAKIEAVATKVNEAKRLADQSSRAATIRVTNKGGDQAAVHAMLFQRDRHLLREAPMMVRVARFMRGTVEKEWTFFLYNDLLVWASTKSNTFKGSAEFHQIVVQECDSPQPKEFVIRVLGGATADDEDQPSELHVVCVTPLVKQTWVAALQQQCVEARNRVDAVRKSMCAPPKLRSPPPT